MPRRVTLASRLADLAKTTRIQKNISLSVPVLTSALSTDGIRRWAWLIPAAAAVLIGVVVTQINVLTDAEVDKDSKPQFLRAIRDDISLASSFIAVEALTLALLLAAVSHHSKASLLSLVACANFGVLYSYNYLSVEPVNRRWKVHWATHAMAFLASYLSLWVAGHTFATGLQGLTEAIPFYLMMSVADYGLYLIEACGDGKEERDAGLKTLAALLSRPTSETIGLTTLVATTVAAYSVHAGGDIRHATLFSNLFRLLGGTFVVLVRGRSVNGPRSAAIVSDWTFHVARATALVLVMRK